MNAGALHQLHDAGDEHVRPVTDGVDLHLFAPDILVYQHRLVRVDLHGGVEVMPQLLLVGDDLHCPSAQHEAGTHQNGIADLPGGGDAVLNAGDGLSLGLGDIQGNQKLFKGVPVFRLFNGGAVGADDVHAQIRQGLRQIDGGLAAQRGNDALGLLLLHHVHYVFHRQRLEVQLVGGGVIRGNGFRVIVDDDGLIACVFNCLDGVDSGIVELHALANADGAGAEDDDLLLVGDHGLVFRLVGGVKIRDIAVEFSCAGVDHLVHRANIAALAQGEHLPLRDVPDLRHRPVGEAHLLCLIIHAAVHDRAGKLPLHGDDVPKLADEECVDGTLFYDFLHAHAHTQQLGDGVDAVVGADSDIVQQVFPAPAVEFRHVQVVHANLQRADALEQTLFKGAADAHGFACGLHLSAETVVGIGELVEGKPGHFGDHIVQRRLEGRAGVGKTNFIQRHANADLRGDPGDWIAGSFGGKCGGTGHSGVDLDEVILEGLGVQRELDVAAALNFQRADQAQGGIPEHVILFVGQRLRRADHDGVACVDAHWVEVLHVADGNGGVVGVPHDLVFDFLEALDALLHQNLMDGRQHQSVFHDLPEFFLVIGKSAAGTAQSKGRAKHHGIADGFRRGKTFLHGIGDLRRKHRLAKTLAKLLEQFPILRLLNRFAGRSQQLHVAFLQNALLFQLHGKVQSRLAADAGDDGVRPLKADDTGDIFQRQRLHVNLVRDGGVGHDGRGVAVAQNDLVALFFQGEAGLRAGIVKFRRLTDDDGTGANDQNFLQIGTFRHVTFPPSWR